MAFTKAKIVMAGLAVTAVCIVAPQQLKAQGARSADGWRHGTEHRG